MTSNTGQEHPYSLRNRNLKSKQPEIVSPIARRTSVPQRVTESDRNNLMKVAVKTYNPLDALLAEKRRLQKTGRDSQAFIQAESMLKAKDTLQEEDLEKWLDERAARSVVQEMLANNESYLEDNNSQDMSLDADNAAKFIGAKGKKVADILNDDKVVEEQSFDVSELRLWAESRSNSDKRVLASYQNCTFHYCGAHPVISLLKTSVDERGKPHSKGRKMVTNLLFKRLPTNCLNLRFWNSCKYRSERLYKPSAVLM